MIRINSIKHYSGTLAEKPSTLPYGDTYLTTDTNEFFKYGKDGLPLSIGENSGGSASLGSDIETLVSNFL